MGLLDIFKNKIDDELFGRLTFFEFEDSTRNYYSGKLQFHGCTIGIYISTNIKGPNSKQKAFFINMQSNYQKTLKSNIQPYLKTELKVNEIENFNDVFELEGICIYQMIGEQDYWSISYYNKTTGNNISIHLFGTEPQHLDIE